MQKIYNFATWKTIIPLLLLFAFFMSYAFPTYQNKINDLAGESLTSLDARISYSKAEVIELFDKMGKDGQKIYHFVSSKIDMVYPIVYGLLFCLLLAVLLKKITTPTSKWRWMCCLPLLGVAFDYLENFSMQGLLNSYPDITVAQVAFSSQMTSLKWGFLTMVLVMVLVLGIWNLVVLLRR